MLDAKKALALANQYTDDSLAGAGALEGKPCQIQSITPITGGNRITFLWVDNDGVPHTDMMDVMNGADGQDGTNGTNGTDGVGISSIAKTGTSGLVDTYTITLTNGDTETFDVTNGADGQNGTNGTNGTDGVGITSIEKTGTSGLVDTYTITLTNGNTETFTVTNGADGQNGTNGTNGADGYSPTATVTKSGNVITIEITDKNGTTTQSIDTSDFATLSGRNDFTDQQVINANESVYKSTNLDKDTAPSQSTDGNAYFVFSDKDGDAFAVVYANQQTSGALDLHIDTYAQNNPNGRVVINGIDVKTLLSKIGGNNLHSWFDIPASVSQSGKMTRIFTADDHLFVGSQVWNNGALTKEGLFYLQPTPSQISLLNGATTSEQGNCNIFDFGCFCMVNLAGVVIPSTWTRGTAICEIPRTATARLNFRIPTTSAGGEIIYIDANSKQLRLTNVVDVPIYTNILIPTYNS